MTRSSSSRRAAARLAPDYGDPAYWRGTIKMSLSKFFVLCVLHRRPMHGYEVVQAVERATRGCCSPTEGTVYPVLNDFEAGGFLTSAEQTVQGRVRKVYALTDKGRAAFRVAVDAWMEITDALALAERLAAGAPTDEATAPDGCC